MNIFNATDKGRRVVRALLKIRRRRDALSLTSGVHLILMIAIAAPLISLPTPSANLNDRSPAIDGVDALPKNDKAYFQRSSKPSSLSEIFIENVGQYDPEVKFVIHGNQGAIFISKQAIWTTVVEFEDENDGSYSDLPVPSATPIPGLVANVASDKPINGVNLQFSFVGANPNPSVEGFGELETTISYIQGAQNQAWVADVPCWSGVRYVDLYPGVDLELTVQNGEWRWKFVYKPIIQPGLQRVPSTGDSDDAAPDLQDVRLRIEGAEKLKLGNRDVALSTVVGDLTLPLLDVEVQEGANRPYSLPPSLDDNEVIAPFGQELKSEDRTDPLVVSSSTSLIGLPLSSSSEPVSESLTSPIKDLPQDFLFSTILGGRDNERGRGIAIDAQGAVYITGSTYSSDFPTTPGAFDGSCNACFGSTDAFVTKLRPDGDSIEYSTFIGGTEFEEGHSIKIDTNGFAYITGHTNSADFPTTLNAFDTSYNLPSRSNNAYALKLTPDGSGLVYSTYLGPNSQGLDIDLDDNGSAYIAGQAFSAGFPTTSGAFDQIHNGRGDGFVLKLDPTGSALLYSTFLGGSGNDCEVGGVLWECSVAVDDSGSVYISGLTNSPEFPTTSGSWDTSYGGNQDAFVSKISADGGSLIYSTFIGGSQQDCFLSCALDIDANGSAYVTGGTLSDDIQNKFDLSKNSGWDGFVAKLSPTGDDLLYFAYFGGSGDEFAHSIVVNSANEAVITGETNSTDFPTTPGAFETCASCPSQPDAFIYKLNATGSQTTYSTYLGGSDYDIGISIDVDGEGIAYVTGETESSDFPVTEGSPHPRNGNVFISAIPVGIGAVEITSAEYRFPASVDPDILGDRATEIWARMYRPAELGGGPYPLIIMLHGNHATCGIYNPFLGIRVDRSTEYTNTGNCPLFHTVVPNHEGYEYIAEPLASAGYIVVSINANRGITGGGPAPGDPFLILARGRLVLKHLQLLQEWSSTGNAPESLGLGENGLIGKIDFENVGFMGHSRGGEGVRAAYDLYFEDDSNWQERIQNLNVKAIFEIAPVDGQAPDILNALDVAWNVLLPMCDGDVSDLQGVKPFDRMLQTNSETSPTQKSVFTVWGANHNFFNTEWQQSDSSLCLGEGNEQLFGVRGESDDQQTIASEAVEALMLGNVGSYSNADLNRLFNPIFNLPGVITSLTRVERGHTLSPDASLTRSIEDFSGPAGWNEQAGVQNDSNNILLQHGQIPRHDPIQRAGNIAWDTPSPNTYFQTNWTSIGSGEDVSSYATLDLRITRQDSDLNISDTTNFSVHLVNSDNSLSNPVQLSDYLELMGPVGGPGGLHPILQTVRIPLSDFTNADLHEFRGVRLSFDDTSSGLISIANIQLSKQLSSRLVWKLFSESAIVSAVWSPFESINIFDEDRNQIDWLNEEGSVEIVLHNPSRFAIRDAPPVLRIGEDFQDSAGAINGEATTMTFALSAEQFANLEDGLPITFLFGPYEYEPVQHYGFLDKAAVEDGQILLLQKPKLSKEIILTDLERLIEETGGDAIEEALPPLQLSVAEDYWLDASHLYPGSGNEVFDHESDAAFALAGELYNPDSTLDKARILSILRSLVDADRVIAAIAIGEAQSEGVDASIIEEAQNELYLGDLSAAEGKYSEAIEHYNLAWWIVISAVSLTVDPAEDRNVDEGEQVELEVATFSDSPFAGDHTATIDWGDGSDPEPATIDEEQGSGSVIGVHAYGDDGEYTVSIEVCNEIDACQQAAFQIKVNNQPPEVLLDTQNAVAFAGGQAFTGTKGSVQSHEATAVDPGSDDLSFIWSFDEIEILSEIFYNDGESEDLDPSPLGVFPFTANSDVDLQADDVGMHVLWLEVSDDDSGSAQISMPKVVRDNLSCTRSFGFWGHQFRGKGRQHIDDATLGGLLEIIDFTSGYFSEARSAATLDEAKELLNPSGPGMLQKAEAQLLSAWLNFASGSVQWEQIISIEADDGSMIELPFHEVILRAEALLLDPESTASDYEMAKDYAEVINLLDDGSTECELD